MSKSLYKILRDGTEVVYINNIPYVEIMKVGTDKHGFYSYVKNNKHVIEGKLYAYWWDYDEWLSIKQAKTSPGFYLDPDQIYTEETL